MGNCIRRRNHNNEHPVSFNPSPPHAPRHESPEINQLRLSPPGSANLEIFTYAEMEIATKKFKQSKIIGEGGFGTVYRGRLSDLLRPCYTDKPVKVAIKQLNRQGLQGEKEWLAEVYVLGQLTHPNLITLIGYCCESDHRLLVYEYMERGSLDYHLFEQGCSLLNWSQIMKIAIGAASGLAFLHGQQRSIIYRDLNASNMLLDDDFNVKLSDFGLAIEGPTVIPDDQLMGTQGYTAPEYTQKGIITTEIDVFSFGTVLLELLFGRRAQDDTRRGLDKDLILMIQNCINGNEDVLGIMYPDMKRKCSDETALREVINLGYECVNEDPSKRPTMKMAIDILNRIETGSFNVMKGEGSSSSTSHQISTVSSGTPGQSSDQSTRIEVKDAQEKGKEVVQDSSHNYSENSCLDG